MCYLRGCEENFTNIYKCTRGYSGNCYILHSNINMLILSICHTHHRILIYYFIKLNNQLLIQ